jgi:hypothetical protein
MTQFLSFSNFSINLIDQCFQICFQGECNFHYNSWNKKLEEESRQQQKLQREIQSIKNVVSHLDAEIATVSGELIH